MVVLCAMCVHEASKTAKLFAYARGEIIPGANDSHTSKYSPSKYPGTSVLLPGRIEKSCFIFALMVLINKIMAITVEATIKAISVVIEPHSQGQ